MFPFLLISTNFKFLYMINIYLTNTICSLFMVFDLVRGRGIILESLMGVDRTCLSKTVSFILILLTHLYVCKIYKWWRWTCVLRSFLSWTLGLAIEKWWRIYQVAAFTKRLIWWHMYYHKVLHPVSWHSIQSTHECGLDSSCTATYTVSRNNGVYSIFTDFKSCMNVDWTLQ